MFIVRVMAPPKGEGATSTYLRDEEFPTRREAVARVQVLGKSGPSFMDAGQKVRVAILTDGSVSGKKK